MDIDRKLTPIDWRILSKAIERYTLDGFQYVELPWIIPVKYNLITYNVPSRIHQTQNGALLGSAEQAFIAKDYNNLLGKGKFVSCSPCFRMEDYDVLHQEQFMKVELYINDDTSVSNYERILDNVHLVLRGFALGHGVPEIIETPEGHDIILNGIEIGSYGIREYEHIKWIYATGLAEPRFSLAKANY